MLLFLRMVRAGKYWTPWTRFDKIRLVQIVWIDLHITEHDFTGLDRFGLNMIGQKWKELYNITQEWTNLTIQKSKKI